jgi:hypothetical protein
MIIAHNLFLLNIIAPEINKEITAGNFTRAAELIDAKLINDVSAEERWNLNFAKEKMDRIRLDFGRTREEIKTALDKYYSDLSEEQIDQWEKDKQLEMKVIDGEKRYFRNAVPNLFRLNKEAEKIKLAKDGPVEKQLNKFLSDIIPISVKAVQNSEGVNGYPVEIKIDYTLTVDADAVPEGEVIRCWLPYPKENHRRQTDIKLTSVNEENYIIADDNHQQRTLYLEKTAAKGSRYSFNMKLQYNSLVRMA